MINNLLSFSFILAQNEAQKNETFLLLAIFALIGCGLIAGFFAGKPFTKEKAVRKPLIFLSVMALFIFFVVYFIMKYND